MPTDVICEATASQTETTAIRQQLARRIGEGRYDKWFGRTELRVDGSHVEVAADNEFVASWIDRNFSDDLRSIACRQLGEAAVVKVHVRRDLFGRQDDSPEQIESSTRVKTPTQPPPDAPQRQRSASRAIILRDLDSFVVGESNRLAYAAARRLAEEPTKPVISPLFIHGECGVGKTHLLQGVCQRYAVITGRYRATRYVTAEQFTNEYIAAVQKNSIDDFRRRIRALDLLAIDDVHFLSNKVKTQGEFLHTLDAIDLTGARVVMASDNHPHHIRRFRNALVNRFLSGMIARVDRPDRETRIEIVRQLAARHGLRIAPAAVDHLALECAGSVRELEGAITKLIALSAVYRSRHSVESTHEIGLALAERVFRERSYAPSAPIRIRAVLEIVCNRLQITRADLLGTSRHRRIVLGRELVALLGYELTTLSYPEIAQELGRRNHSTVHAAAKRLRQQIEARKSVQVLDGDWQPVDELVSRLKHDIQRGSHLPG